MLAFAPTPAEDEMLMSVAARWYALSGFDSPREFLAAAFGHDVGFVACDLGASVPLASSAGVVLNAEQIAMRHTLQPFMRHFVDSSAMQGFHDGKMSRAAAKYLSKELRCPRCAADQRSQSGSAFWLRTHNLPGVTVCHLHCCKLQQFAWKRGALDLVPKEANSTDEEPADMKSMWYARQAAKLLRQSCPVVSFPHVQRAFRSAVHRRYLGTEAKAGAPSAALFTTLQNDIAPLLHTVPQAVSTVAPASPASVLLKDLQPGSSAIDPVLAIYLAQVCAPAGVSSILEDAARLHTAPVPVESRSERLARLRKERDAKLKAKWRRWQEVAQKARQKKSRPVAPRAGTATLDTPSL